MRKTVFVMTAAFGLIFGGGPMNEVSADAPPGIRYSKKVRHTCQGPKCAPYAPCGPHCRVVCPDISSCYSLSWRRGQYGPYNPARSVLYWGRFTPSGWGIAYSGAFPRAGWGSWWW